MNSYLKVIREIKSGRNLETNLLLYFDYIMNDYYKMSLIRLSMKYYTFYESLSEYDYLNVDFAAEALKIIDCLIFKYISGTENTDDRESDIKIINDIRKELTARMEETVNYSKAFGVAEYALNRVEHRFDGKISKVDDNTLIQSILQYIFSDKENVVVNDKIKLVMGQLPVRMAKSKLYNLISNCLTLYKGSDRTALDSFVRMIEDAAMLNIPVNGFFSDFNQTLKRLVHADYAAISPKDFHELKEMFDDCSDRLTKTSDCYMSLMEIINDMYEIVLSYDYVTEDFQEGKVCAGITSKVAECIESGFFEQKFDECIDSFAKLEGVQENMMLEIPQLEAILYGIEESDMKLIETLELDKKLRCANACSLLNSTSAFVDVENSGRAGETQSKADDSYIEVVRDVLIGKISGKLSEYGGLIRRGIMAGILSELPVQFRTSNEVCDYITSSLSSCKDTAEKTAFVEIIDQLISE